VVEKWVYGDGKRARMDLTERETQIHPLETCVNLHPDSCRVAEWSYKSKEAHLKK